MKKSVIVLWIVAALFLISAISFLVQGAFAEFVVGLLIAAGLFFFGKRKQSVTKTAERKKGDRSRTVYYTLDSKCYHYNRKCLSQPQILSCTENQVKVLDLYPCPKCCKH